MRFELFTDFYANRLNEQGLTIPELRVAIEDAAILDKVWMGLTFDVTLLWLIVMLLILSDC